MLALTLQHSCLLHFALTLQHSCLLRFALTLQHSCLLHFALTLQHSCLLHFALTLQHSCLLHFALTLQHSCLLCYALPPTPPPPTAQRSESKAQFLSTFFSLRDHALLHKGLFFERPIKLSQQMNNVRSALYFQPYNTNEARGTLRSGGRLPCT